MTLVNQILDAVQDRLYLKESYDCKKRLSIQEARYFAPEKISSGTDTKVSKAVQRPLEIFKDDLTSIVNSFINKNIVADSASLNRLFINFDLFDIPESEKETRKTLDKVSGVEIRAIKKALLTFYFGLRDALFDLSSFENSSNNKVSPYYNLFANTSKKEILKNMMQVMSPDELVEIIMADFSEVFFAHIKKVRRQANSILKQQMLNTAKGKANAPLKKGANLTSTEALARITKSLLEPLLNLADSIKKRVLEKVVTVADIPVSKKGFEKSVAQSFSTFKKGMNALLPDFVRTLANIKPDDYNINVSNPGEVSTSTIKQIFDKELQNSLKVLDSYFEGVIKDIKDPSNPFFEAFKGKKEAEVRKAILQDMPDVNAKTMSYTNSAFLEDALIGFCKNLLLSRLEHARRFGLNAFKASHIQDMFKRKMSSSLNKVLELIQTGVLRKITLVFDVGFNDKPVKTWSSKKEPKPAKGKKIDDIDDDDDMYDEEDDEEIEIKPKKRSALPSWFKESRAENKALIKNNYLLKEEVGELKTWGDLKKVLSKVSKNKNIKDVLKMLGSIAIGAVGGNVAGAGYEILKGIFYNKTGEKTNTWIDQLNIDPYVAKIVDDTVEANFIKYLYKVIQSHKDDEPLPESFNINNRFTKYLMDKYMGRYVYIPK